MVQVLMVYDSSVPLMFLELDRQPFLTLSEAKVAPGNSTTYVKWAHHLLLRDLETDDLAGTRPYWADCQEDE